MSHSPSKFNTFIYSFSKFSILSFFIYEFGFLYGIISTTLFFWIFTIVIKVVFDLERLSSGDRYFLNSDDSVFTIMVGGVFELENLNEDKLRKHLINRVYKRVKKVSAKVTEILGDYFFTYSHLNIPEDEKLKMWNNQITTISCKKK